ncbi:MAG: hypothetical protein ACRDQ7_06100 [Haloechinothrix sp.]
MELTHLGDDLASEARDALRSAIHERAGDVAIELSFLSSGRHPVLVLSAIVRGGDPLAAASQVSACLNQSLIYTGLFDHFDVTGKLLRVAPLETMA